MKTTSLLALLLLLLSPFVQAQTGKVFDNLSLPSKILKMDRKYSIYLPADYETSNRRYPVLYLLHGAGDDQTGWIQFGEVNQIADKAIAEGKSTPMIIVMPDAKTGKMGYFNAIDGNFNYEDFFFEELIPFIEKTYRVHTEKRFRAIAGLSMGGGGTIIYALHHPELFSSAYPLSAGNGLQEFDAFKGMYAKTYPTFTEEQVRTYYNKYNGFELVNSLPNDQTKAVRWYVDCGDDDPRSETNSKLHALMNKKGIPHEFRIGDGGHTWSYWRNSLPEVLSFVSQGFHQF